MSERWTQGAFTHETMEGTVQLNAKALGMAEMLDAVINLEADTFDE